MWLPHVGHGKKVITYFEGIYQCYLRNLFENCLEQFVVNAYICHETHSVPEQWNVSIYFISLCELRT